MKRILLSMIFCSVITVYGQDWGVGVRVGDPLGITVKKYEDDRAIELSIGTANLLYDKKLYVKNISDWYLNRSTKHQDFQYSINKATGPFGFQIHYLYHKGLPEFQWYYGAGAQFRIQKCSYTFRYKIPGDPSWQSSTGSMVTDIDMGLDGVTGIEFTPATIPISLFLDLTLFMEAGDEPFIFWFQGGAGLRYNFGGGTSTTPLPPH